MQPDKLAVVRRLFAAFRSRPLDDDLRDEIASHLAEAADEYVRQGMTPEDARLAARRSFGGVTQAEQVHREVRSFAWLADLRQDLQLAGRSFVRNPGFTLVAVLTLALGIGATTMIFTLLDAVIFKPLPVPKPHELVTFYENGPEGSPDAAGGTGRFLRFSYGRFERLQQALGSRGSIAAVTRTTRLLMRLPGDPQRRFLRGQFVSGGYFATLGLQAARGRMLTPEDVSLEPSSSVAVVSDGFWRRVLGGSDAALGETIVVNDVAVTVIGVAPRGFVGTWSDSEADMWLPVTLQHPMRYHTNSSSYGEVDNEKPWMLQDVVAWLNLVARVRTDDMREVLPQLQRANHDGVVQLAEGIQNPKDRPSMLAHTLAIEPLSHGFSGLRAGFSDALFVLAGLVTLVLAVTCANIGNLLLVRAAAQARDFRIRISLGASTARLVRQCLTESVALALLGGACGLWLSSWGSGYLARQVLGMTSGELPLVFAPDARVLMFVSGVSVGAAIVFGLVPAFRAIAAGRLAAAGSHQRAPVGPLATHGMGALAVSQLALSIVLVTAAALLGRTLVGFMRIDPGFAVDRIVTVSIDPVTSGYADDALPALARRLVASARSVPGVVDSAAATCGLIANCSSSGGFRVEGAGDGSATLHINWTSPRYFGTAGIPFVSGRDFGERDTANSPQVAIINESIARHYFAAQNPIGKRLGPSGLDIEVVGVVRDARTQSLHDLPVPMVYFPIEQKPAGKQPTLTNLDVRIGGTAATIEPALRRAIQLSEPNLLIGDIGAMSRRLSRDLMKERIVALLALAFGALTLLLASLGLYGVLSYGVARRTQEIGVRMALGARRADVLTLVGWQSARLTVVGMTLGLLATWVGSRYLSGMLPNVAPLNPATLGVVAVAFAVVTMLASYVPARRATNVDPLVALRSE